MTRQRKTADFLRKFAVYSGAFLVMALLVLMIGYILVRGLGGITWDFLSTAPSILKGTFGILPNILNTLYVILLCLVISLPLGVGAAVYLTEYATNPKLKSLIEAMVETLAAIPSIIYGLVGMLFFCNWMGLKLSLLSGCLTMVIVILPTIIRTTQESLKTVPASYREGALGLGATKWHMIRTIIVPSALDGIITGAILAVGRIVGESAALLFTAGLATGTINSIWDAYGKSGGTLSVSLYMYAMEEGEFEVAFTIGAVLLIIVFAINALTMLVQHKLKKSFE
ncbi:MAG: phosphate ABC transporter permease PstA [Eubacteriales bacterium]